MRSDAFRRSRKARQGTELLCERVFRPLAHLVVVALAPLRVPPPLVAAASGATGIAAAVELARGHLLAAALVLQLKTVLDNADGQLARLSGRVTLLGRYLDSECDLLVDAALFAALGWATGRPLLALGGFLALTAVLSVNFNVERLHRGAPADTPPARGLTRALQLAYGLLYGWQDRLMERWSRPDRPTVAVLANLGMTTQLAAFSVCTGLGRPLAYVWVLAGELVFVAALAGRRALLVSPGIDQEVSLEHR